MIFKQNTKFTTETTGTGLFCIIKDNCKYFYFLIRLWFNIIIINYTELYIDYTCTLNYAGIMSARFQIYSSDTRILKLEKYLLKHLYGSAIADNVWALTYKCEFLSYKRFNSKGEWRHVIQDGDKRKI